MKTQGQKLTPSGTFFVCGKSLRIWIGVGMLMLGFMGMTGVALAGVNRWTSIGLEGGIIQSLAIDPGNSNIVYAGTREDGVFKSTDGGG
jgi:hypothetical protein